MSPEWGWEIRRRVRAAEGAFFFKQWGGRNKKAAGRELDGRHDDDLPRPKRRMATV